MCSLFLGHRRRALLVEAVLWLPPIGIFLTLYVAKFEASPSVLFPHLVIVAAFWFGALSLRLMNWRLTDMVNGSLQKWMAAILMLLPPLLLMFWYASVLIGLSSWGRVTTWPLLKAYLFQMGQLSEVLGLSSFVCVAVLAALLLLFLMVFRFVIHLDGSKGISQKLSPAGFFAISVLGMAAMFSQFISLAGWAELHPQEPIGLSFSPGLSPALQNHVFSVSPLIESAESRGRISYKVDAALNGRNVVLIVGDALRSDHMGIYGYHRPTTPLIEASATVHQTLMPRITRSICAESSCGLMSLASSRPLHLLPTKPITLHEVLRLHGYRINLMLGGDHTNFYGLKEAYGLVDSYFDGTHQNARYLNDDLLITEQVEQLPKYDGVDPVMFQFHLMSTHGLGLKHESSEAFLPSVNYYRWPSGKGRTAPSPEEALKAVNHYDNGVLQFDQIVHRLLSELESKGYLDNAVVVITGDHGEMLGEKKYFGHQYRVDEGVLRVPLILQRRGYKGESLGDWPLASQIDVAPTILDELGITAPAVWRGVALQRPAVSRIVYFQQAPQVGLYEASLSKPLFKYWKNMADGEEFVYELQADPDEASNIAASVEKTQLAAWSREAMGSSVSRQEPTAD